MLNETNISIDVSKVIIETEGSIFIEILKNATPIASVIVTALVAIWTIRANYRNLIVQMNQSEIMNNIKEFAVKIRTTYEKEDMYFFIDSEKGIYIPTPLRNKIKKILREEKSSKVSEASKQKMLGLLNEYIT